MILYSLQLILKSFLFVKPLSVDFILCMCVAYSTNIQLEPVVLDLLCVLCVVHCCCWSIYQLVLMIPTNGAVLIQQHQKREDNETTVIGTYGTTLLGGVPLVSGRLLLLYWLWRWLLLLQQLLLLL